AALAFETLPAKGRGFFSGLLQEGYVLGFLLASLVSRFAFEHVGWRGMFVIGAAPALLVFYIRRNVGESPAWLAGNANRLSAALLALPMIPLWAFAQTPLLLALGGFLMQFMVQGAWGIVPAHLNELSPGAVRAILPGFAYQLGNFVMSQLSPIQARIAEGHGN